MGKNQQISRFTAINKGILVIMVICVLGSLLFMVKWERNHLETMNTAYAEKTVELINDIYEDYSHFYRFINDAIGQHDVNILGEEQVGIILMHLSTFSPYSVGARYYQQDGSFQYYDLRERQWGRSTQGHNSREADFLQEMKHVQGMTMLTPILDDAALGQPVVVLGYSVRNKQDDFIGVFATAISVGGLYEHIVGDKGDGVVIDFINRDNQVLLSSLDGYRYFHSIRGNSQLEQMINTGAVEGHVQYNANADRFWYTSMIKINNFPYYVRVSKPVFQLFLKSRSKYFMGFGFINLLFLSYLLTTYKLWVLKREQLEEEMLNGEKLQVLSEMAATTADQVRNPLTSIKGFVDLLTEQNKDDEQREILDIITSEVNKIDSSTREFMLLAREGYVDKISVNPCQALREVVKEFQQAGLPPKFQFHLDCVENSSPVLTNPFELKQVYKYVITNALEAMPGGGEVTISCRVDRDLSVVNITVRDLGCGMSQPVLDKAGFPFFTTKEGRLGLGLYLTKEIVGNYGGQLTVESEPNQGTRVNICLPIDQEGV